MNAECNDMGAEQAAADNVDGAIAAALLVAVRFGQTDGGHHKAWVIDQMVRALLGDRYEAWVVTHNAGEDGPHTYEWGCGIAP